MQSILSEDGKGKVMLVLQSQNNTRFPFFLKTVEFHFFLILRKKENFLSGLI